MASLRKKSFKISLLFTCSRLQDHSSLTSGSIVHTLEFWPFLCIIKKVNCSVIATQNGIASEIQNVRNEEGKRFAKKSDEKTFFMFFKVVPAKFRYLIIGLVRLRTFVKFTKYRGLRCVAP